MTEEKSGGDMHMPEHKNALIVGGFGLAGIVSLLTLYSSLATEAWVNGRINEKLEQAPITVEARMRIAPIEADLKEVKNTMKQINVTMGDMRVELGIIARGIEVRHQP